MELDLATLVTVAGSAISVVVWLVRLEGRINTQDELRKALEGRISGFEERVYDVLERIERKIDGKADRR